MAESRRWVFWRWAVYGLVAVPSVAAVAWGISIELDASPLQARLFSRFARGLTYSVEPGPNPEARFPKDGPYDERLGYTLLPAFIASMTSHGYATERQARLSPDLRAFLDGGGFAVFPEKAQTGLTLRDRNSHTVYVARHPERVFPDFDALPRLIVDTLLFIENRELLDARHPTQNPAIEWDRFAAAALNVLAEPIDPSGQRFGGSTLATQIEKYRHSPDGRTSSIEDKLRQITAASLRAYRNGIDTTAARREIVVDYVNSTPLAARPGFGEVIGLGDGLWAWYGTDFETAAKLLAAPAVSEEQRAKRALVYKQMLSLLLAQRRPSHYLLAGREDLTALTDRYLRLLASAGIIDSGLRNAALATKLSFRVDPPAPAEASFVDRKAINAMRTHLLSMLGVSDFYKLDRLDIGADTALDAPAQRRVTEAVQQITNPTVAAGLGLTGFRLLAPGDTRDVAYSVTLYERGEHGNCVRLQADNLDRPLDLNEGGKFDLGSTAKFRTLITYLSIVAELHGRYARLSRAELREVAEDAEDALTGWAAAYLASAASRELQPMLDAAMARKYSASPGERFFTGRGMHAFANFDPIDNGRVMTVADAFRNSVNLVFIRMMRDIVKFYMADGPEPSRDVLVDPSHPSRRQYLQRFADDEGRVFLTRFFGRYKGKTPDETLALLASRARPVPHRLAVVFRSARPRASLAEFRAFLNQRLPEAPDEAQAEKLYSLYGPDRFSLNDRGYIARVQPLELWLVGFLQTHPQATRAEAIAASEDERLEAYAWLFKSKRKRAADTRIRIMLEEDAFRHVLRAWQRLGYPFDYIVPSYATAIGSSADRPQALAELMGIVLNDGVHRPTVRIEALHFAEGTPYETHLVRDGSEGERLLPKEVAATARRALISVVEDGTARRVKGAFVDANGAPLPIGGKTGTGDELADGPGGRGAVVGKEVSRSAAFVFFIGDRFFGTITAHAPGTYARHFKFTSALPVQVLKALAPAIQPLIAPAPSSAPQRPEPTRPNEALAAAYAARR